MNRRVFGAVACALATLTAGGVRAAVAEYGDEDVLGTSDYGGDPKAGATLEGLAPGVTTFGAAPVGHGYPFAPEGDDFPGMDQIYVGMTQTGFHDGYSDSPRLNGPQIFSLDYSNLVPAGQSVASLTLGVAADDFQFASIQQPFAASVNGFADAALTATLNSLDQSGPVVQFFTIGVDVGLLTANHVLTLSIDQGGDGGDGWAVDFLTVGVTTVPEPFTAALALPALAGWLRWTRRRT